MTAAAVILGLVVAIADGDTLTVLNSDLEQVRVRLAEIDAPEKRQPFGTRSRQSLAALCHETRAEVRVVDVDRYKRIVGRVHCGGVDANAAQVRRGMAWVYERYATDAALPELQDEARAAKRGLWVDPAPVPPWEWRKR
jgi:micrococcal nuclease